MLHWLYSSGMQYGDNINVERIWALEALALRLR